MRFAVLAGFAMLTMVAAGCRAGLAPGLMHRFDTGSFDPGRHRSGYGTIIAEAGAYVPLDQPYIGGAGVFMLAGTRQNEGPDSHSRFDWTVAMLDLRYRRVFSETPATRTHGARRRYWAVGAGGGVSDSDDGIGGTFVEIGIEFVFGRTSFDLSLRHRYLIEHEPGLDLWKHLNVFQVGFAFGAAH